MAIAKQTPTLILIFACIIFTTCTNANPILKHVKPADKSSNHAKPSQAEKPSNNAKPSQADKRSNHAKPSQADKHSNHAKPSQLSVAPGNKGMPPPKGKAEVANMVAKQMQGVQKKIDEFNASLKKRLNNPKSSPRTRECVSECDEVFGAANDDIKKTLDSLKCQNLVKANFDVSAVSTNVDTCNDCFLDMGKGGDAEVKKFNDWVRKITGDALAALQKAA